MKTRVCKDFLGSRSGLGGDCIRILRGFHRVYLGFSRVWGILKGLGLSG